jgi:hypothetical protein
VKVVFPLVNFQDHTMKLAQVSDIPAITAPQPGLQVLTPLEVAAVAGGPEMDVGNGVTPP